MTRTPLGSLVADRRWCGRAAGHGDALGHIAADSRAMSKLHARVRIVVFAYESGRVVPGLG